MNSSLTKTFRSEFAKLPPEVQRLAVKNYRLWQTDPRHPSLQFKRVGAYWSVRVGLTYRALGGFHGDQIYWFWIGHHMVYEKMLKNQ